MSTHIKGFKPADAKYTAMLSAWDACIAVKVAPPADITKYFGTSERSQVDAAGVCVELHPRYSKAQTRAVAAWSDDSAEGFEVDLRGLDPDVKILRFYNSY